VIHFTGLINLKATLKWLSSHQSHASLHVVIGRNGEVAQLVPFNYKAWHAGGGSYAGRKGFNQYSIAIGLENAMMLEKMGDKYVNPYGLVISADEVIEAPSKNDPQLRYWHKYTDIQIQKIREVCKLLAESYKIKMIIGHADIAPGRKLDPGPAFPDMEQFSKKILGNIFYKNNREGE